MEQVLEELHWYMAGLPINRRKNGFVGFFPRSIQYSELDAVYFPRVRSMLQASPIPDDILESPYFLSSRILQAQATQAGLRSRKIDIAYDWDIVRQEMAGEKVPSVISGQYYHGVESGANNSVDRNYLKMAEETGYVEIRPLHVVTSIGALSNGRYRVLCNQINEQGEVLAQKTFVCRYLFLAAGSIGTTELLVRAKAERSLRRLNRHVGWVLGNEWRFGDDYGQRWSNQSDSGNSGRNLH